MSDPNIKEILKKNGQVILNLLKRNGKSTVSKLTNDITRVVHMEPSVVRDQVQDILRKGVALGFIDKSGMNYSAHEPVEPATPVPKSSRSRSKRGARSGKQLMLRPRTRERSRS